jgi:hypothetical protein
MQGCRLWQFEKVSQHAEIRHSFESTFNAAETGEPFCSLFLLIARAGRAGARRPEKGMRSAKSL